MHFNSISILNRPQNFFIFGAIMPKGEKILGQSKRTTPPPFLKTFSKKGRDYSNCKTLLTAKGRTSLGGEFSKT
jgi:hypothetical protein